MAAFFSHRPGGGRRSLFSFGTTVSLVITSVGELFLRAHNVTPAASQNYIAHRSGSVVGVSGMLDISAVGTSGNVLLKAQTGNPQVDRLTTATQNISAPGNFLFRATADPGVHPFSAGDLIVLSWLGDGSTSVTHDLYLATLEVEWDD